MEKKAANAITCFASVSLTVSPERSQFFKFESFSVICVEEEQDEDKGSGWAVMKRTADGEVGLREQEVCHVSDPSWSSSGSLGFSDASNLLSGRCTCVPTPAPSVKPFLPQTAARTGAKQARRPLATLSTSLSPVVSRLCRSR